MPLISIFLTGAGSSFFSRFFICKVNIIGQLDLFPNAYLCALEIKHMISVNQITINFGGFELFSGISFQINQRDRIGLVGRTGQEKQHS
jgi:ABC-type multidrug transport system fused ATPase/permease subunit